MTFTFVVNPQAGGRLFKRGRRNLLAALPDSGLQYEVATTEGRGHAAELARQAAQRSDVVVAVGGDGTVHEVVSGLVKSGTDARLGVIPVGTGNDFAKMLEIPRKPKAALAALSNGRARRVDYGRVRWEGGDGGGEATFINVAGTGIDASVAEAAAGFRFLTGTPRYLAAVIQTLQGWNAPDMAVQISENGRMRDLQSGEHLLVIVGNGRCAAGGFYLTPAARIDDGRLDVCAIRSAPLRRILAIIPGVIRGGRHVREPEVMAEQAEKITVTSIQPLPIQADGEVLTDRATKVTFEVVSGGLSVVQPVKR